MDNSDANALLIINALIRIGDLMETNNQKTDALLEYWRISNEDRQDAKTKRAELFPFEKANYELSLENYRLSNELLELKKGMFNGA